MNDSFNKIIEKTKVELGDFFNMDISDIEVVVIPNRKEFDKVRGMETKPWQIGTGKNSKVEVLDPDVWKKEGVHDPKTFPDLIKHEMVHVIYRKITDGTSKPFWLNEGLAYFVADQEYAINKDDKGLLPSDVFDNNSLTSQRVGYPIVKSIVDIHGKEALLKLVNNVRPMMDQEEFNKEFNNLFGKDPDEYYLELKKTTGSIHSKL